MTTNFFGFVGPSCLAEAKELRQRLAALGIECEVTVTQPKPELSESLAEAEVQQQGIQQQGGQ